MDWMRLRAWDDEGQKMYYGKIEQFDDSLLIRFEHFDTDNPVYMRPTGLKDKNGKEIYEGDIVKPRYNRFDPIVVEFVGGQYPIREYDLKRCEVIGNIHENADLV